jgi:hypothetical protein
MYTGEDSWREVEVNGVFLEFPGIILFWLIKNFLSISSILKIKQLPAIKIRESHLTVI